MNVYAHLSFLNIYEPGPRTPTPRWYGPPQPPNLAFAPPPSCTLPRYAAFESHILVTGTVWGLATTTAKFGEVPGGKATMDAMTFVDGNAELIADMHLRHRFVHTRPLCEKSMQSSARRSSHVVSIYVYFMSKQFLLTGRGLSKIGANGMTAGKKLQFCH